MSSGNVVPMFERRRPAEVLVAGHGHLRLSLRSVNQLFNSFDPSPFYEKDLDANAEAFLVSWATELHPHADLRLTLYLKERPEEPAPERWVPQAVHHYFTERARLAEADLKGLLRRGRVSLLVGLAFLAACVALAELFGRMGPGVTTTIFREGFTIAGWVALWRPLQIYLYDWWPLRERLLLLRRMGRMPVDLRIGAE